MTADEVRYRYDSSTQTESAYRAMLGCDWMTAHESRQAIPPAFTEWIGNHVR